jgi:hypothetical protein
MSWLKYARASHRVELYAGTEVGDPDSALLGSWPVNPQPSFGSIGPWPDGKHRWSHYSLRSDQPGMGEGQAMTPSGIEGVHVFQWNDLNGIGVQAMRSPTSNLIGGPGGLKIGALKVNDIGMSVINSVQQGDPLIALLVVP